jgi:hypothetical protein
MLPPKEQMEKLKAEQNRFQQPEPPARGVEGFGPPQFEGDEVSARGSQFTDKDELESAYNQFNKGYEPELEKEYPEEAEYGFNPPPSFENPSEYPTPPSMRQKGASFLKEDAIFTGGPSRSEVASWKRQFETDGHSVHLSEVGDEVFIWRTLNRTEYREIMALPNTDPLQREEIICEICTLFPYEYNFTSMASRKAGTPAVLADQMMHESGFKQPTPPIRL